MYSLVGECARAGNNAPRTAGLDDGAGHDADLALTWGEQTWAVGADQAGLRPGGQIVFDLHHVQYRDTLGDADHQLNAGVGCFHDGVSSKTGRYKDHGSIGTSLFAGFLDRVENRDIIHFLTALARGYTGNDVGAIGDAGTGMEHTFRTGNALYK